MFKRNNNIKKKKAEETYTLVLIPSSSAKTYKLSVSKKLINRSAVLIGVVLLALFALTAVNYVDRDLISQVKYIKEENREKEEAMSFLEKEIQEIEKQHDSIDKKQAEIKKLMGIKVENEEAFAETPSRGGQGGADVQRDPNLADGENFKLLEKTQTIKTALSQKEHELDALLAKVSDDKNYFRCIPNQWPVSGEITSPYGWRRSPFGGRSESFHDGIDIANAVGTPIMAAGDGKVVHSGYMAVYGRTILIDHGYGLSSKYAHNSALLVEEGDLVKKGDQIARLGSTGRSTGPHLHFSIYKWGQVQDPSIYLP